MKLFNKNFFIGFAAGVVIIIGALTTAGYLYISSMKKRFSRGRKEMLKPPPIAARDEKMDYNWSIHDLKGNEFDLSKTKGKVVFLNFWATWCSPCIAEMPSIQNLYEELKDEGVVFLCVSREGKKSLRKFVLTEGSKCPIYSIQGDKPAVFETRGIPATFIISRSGEIVFRHTGSAKWDDEKCKKFIRELLK